MSVNNICQKEVRDKLRNVYRSSEFSIACLFIMYVSVKKVKLTNRFGHIPMFYQKRPAKTVFTVNANFVTLTAIVSLLVYIFYVGCHSLIAAEIDQSTLTNVCNAWKKLCQYVIQILKQNTC